MNIFFQTKKIEIGEREKAHMARRMEGLKKFFSPHVQVYIDVERTHNSRNGDDLFYVSINLEDGRHRYFSEEYKEGVRKAFDYAYRDFFRMIRKERGRANAIMKSAGRTFKRIFKRKAR